MQRPDPMIASKPGAEDVQAMTARTLWMEELFFLDGRDHDQPPAAWSVYWSWLSNIRTCSQLTVTDGEVT